MVGLFFTIAIGAQGLHTSCTFVNAMDLSPNFVGTISAMLYGLGSCMGIVVPIVVGLVAPNVCDLLRTQSHWVLIPIFEFSHPYPFSSSSNVDSKCLEISDQGVNK